MAYPGRAHSILHVRRRDCSIVTPYVRGSATVSDFGTTLVPTAPPHAIQSITDVQPTGDHDGPVMHQTGTDELLINASEIEHQHGPPNIERSLAITRPDNVTHSTVSKGPGTIFSVLPTPFLRVRQN